MNVSKYLSIKSFAGEEICLVAVSKMRSPEEIMELYAMGHLDFGENYVQELVEKKVVLPEDIRWHFIGHLQSNKVKFIAPFVHLIHSVDSYKLLMEINKQGKKHDRVIDCLLQVHIARETTKHGLSEQELDEIVNIFSKCSHVNELANIRIKGLMGMATFTHDQEQVRKEFRFLKHLYDKYSSVEYPNFKFSILSMGMSDDYQIALEEGSNMLRVGSLIFGPRTKSD